MELVRKASHNKHCIYTRHTRRNLGSSKIEHCASGMASLKLPIHADCFCFIKRSSHEFLRWFSHRLLCCSHRICGLNTPCCDTSSENEAATSYSILSFIQKSNTMKRPLDVKHRSNHNLISSIMIQPSPLRRGINNILTKLACQAAALIYIQMFCRSFNGKTQRLEDGCNHPHRVHVVNRVSSIFRPHHSFVRRDSEKNNWREWFTLFE